MVDGEYSSLRNLDASSSVPEETPREADEEIGPIISRRSTAFNAADLLSTNVIELPENVYGSMMMAVIRTCMSSSHLGVAFLQLMGLLLNVVLQVCVALFIQIYVSRPAVKKVQDFYGDYEGQLNHRNSGYAALENLSDEERDEVCQIPFSQMYFIWIMLAIWTGYVLKDLRESCMYMHVLWQLPHTKQGEDLIDFEKNDDGLLVVKGAAKRVKAAIALLTMFPKLGIAAFLWWIGARWLVATTSFEDIIMNSVALAFIFDLDEMFHGALSAAETRKRVAQYAFEVQEDPWFDDSVARLLEDTLVNGLMILILFGLPMLYLRFWQQVLPDYQWDVKAACDEYLEAEYSHY